MNEDAELPFPMLNYDLTGEVTIVAGGTKGLGYGVVVAPVYYGMKVAIISGHQDSCDRVIKEVTKLGGETIGIKTDAQVKEEADLLVAKTVKTYGKLDIMVGSAGVAITKSVLEISKAEYSTVMDLNLKSVFFGPAATTKEMIKQGTGGRITSVASIGGLIGTRNISAYGASKAAALNLTKGTAVKFGKYGIAVSSVCLGYMKTALNAEVLDSPWYQERVFKKIPLRRRREAEEVVAIVLFLTSDFLGIMTGSYIVADMGITSG